MITMAVLYVLACGDIEATLHGVGGNSIMVCDCDPKGAALIAWLREHAASTVSEGHKAWYILEVVTLTF